jgi:hypothetical protein
MFSRPFESGSVASVCLATSESRAKERRRAAFLNRAFSRSKTALLITGRIKRNIARRIRSSGVFPLTQANEARWPICAAISKKNGEEVWSIRVYHPRHRTLT